MADNLLDKASILLTPTAYDNGRMLSVKPENGGGDFDFERNSAATRVNAQGLVENVQIISSELVLNGNFSQEGSELITNGGFDTDSNWTLSSGISYNSNGYIDFDGTQGSGQARNTPNITFVAEKTYKVVYEIKNYVSGTIRFRFQNGVNTIGQQQSGDGVKTEYIVCNDSLNNNFQFFNSPSFNGSIDNVSVKEVGQNWDFDGDWTIGENKIIHPAGSSPEYSTQDNVLTIGKNYTYSVELLTGNVTNFAQLYVEGVGAIAAFTNGAGVYTGSFTAQGTNIRIRAVNADIDVEVTNISVKEITDDTNLPRIDYTDGCGSWLLEPQSTNLYLNSETLSTQSNATSASTYTVSFYGTGTITFSGTHTGTLVGTAADERVSATFTTTSGTLTSTISGTCNKGQLENLSYATSYIPTNGAANTRLQDIATNSGNASLINSTEGVLYAEIADLSDNVNKLRFINIADTSSTFTDRISIGFRQDNRILFEVFNNNSLQMQYFDNTTNVLEFNKMCVRYKNNDCAVFVNGVKVHQDTSATIPSNLSTLIMAGYTNGTFGFEGKVKALAVYKEALTDAELQSLTTI